MLTYSGFRAAISEGEEPSVPLTVSPLNPKAQGGNRRAASGFPDMPDMRNSSIRWTPGIALSARGLTVWRIRQERINYRGVWSVDFQLSKLVKGFVQLVVDRLEPILVIVHAGRRLAASQTEDFVAEV